MGVFDAFNEFQQLVDADAGRVTLARERRDIFKRALSAEPDVVTTWGSGSLRRSTQLQPVHDVDIVVEFNPADHPDWGTDGASSEAALEHVRSRVRDLLGIGESEGSVDQLVRLAKPRNRAVKCFIDPPSAADAFTVDVMPVLRQSDGTLLLPGKRDRVWSRANPELLIQLVEDRQAQWSNFRRTVRLLKRWRLEVPVTGRIKSLVMEILALECLPLSGPNRPEALRAFFTAAAAHPLEICDPAGLCGPVQRDLDIAGLRRGLERSADSATAALNAAANSDTGGALRAWRDVFGPEFPVPEGLGKAPTSSGGEPLLVAPRPIKDAPQG